MSDSRRAHLPRLLCYLKPYWGRVVCALVLSFAIAALMSVSLSTMIPILRTLFEPEGTHRLAATAGRWLAFLGPGVSGWVSSTCFSTPLAALGSMLAVVIFISILRGVLRFFDDQIVGTVAVAACRDLTNELYGSLIRQPVLFFEREGVGTVAAKFTADADEVVRGLKTLTGTVFRAPFQFLTLLALAIWLSPLLTVVSLVVFPALALLIRRSRRVSRRTARSVLTHRGRLLSILQESFFGIRIVQGFCGEARQAERFRGENESIFDRSRKLIRVEAVLSPAMEVLVALGVAGSLLLGGRMVLHGDLGPEELITFYTALVALYEPVRKMGACVPRIEAGLAGAGRIFAYLDREPEVRSAPAAKSVGPLGREIRFEDVSYSYGGRSEALRNVAFAIDAGEYLAVVGPSGSGKSTLTGLLPRFYDPEEGAVLFDGEDLRALSLGELRSRIALVTQDTFLLDDSIRRNIAFGKPDASESEIRAAADAAGVSEFAEVLPRGYDTVVGERGARLSGGQRQRIALARALIAHPSVLVLDEATSNVDELSARLIRQALSVTRQDLTTIVVTHRLDHVAGADRVAVMSGGRLEAIGRPSSLLRTSSTYRELRAAAEAIR